MKNKMLTLVFCLCSLSAFSQVKKGTMLADVSLGGMSFNSDNGKTSYSNDPDVSMNKGTYLSIGVYPTIGYFIADGLAIGSSVNIYFSSSNDTYSYSGSSITYESKSTQPSFSIGPYARYYFGGNDNGKLFAQAKVGFGMSTSKSSSSTSGVSTSESKSNPNGGNWDAGLSIGYEHFFGEYLGLFGSLGVTYNKFKTEYEYTPSSGTGYSYTSETSRIYVPLNFGLLVHIPSKGNK